MRAILAHVPLAGHEGAVARWAEDLRRWLNSEPIVARPPGVWGRAVRWCRRHPALTALAGVFLIAAPWIFRFSEHTAATVVPVVLGIGLIAYSLFTDYELGVWKVAPMAVHNLIDIVAGALLVASPWLFGFADETANVWLPHVVVGLAAIFLGLTTKQAGGYSYRTPKAATE